MLAQLLLPNRQLLYPLGAVVAPEGITVVAVTVEAGAGPTCTVPLYPRRKDPIMSTALAICLLVDAPLPNTMRVAPLLIKRIQLGSEINGVQFDVVNISPSVSPA